MPKNSNAKNIEELENENKLLLEQLSVVQEELEQYFIKYKDIEYRSLASTRYDALKWVDDVLLETLVENHRLETLNQVQSEVTSIENKNSLNARLGNIFIKANGSLGNISKLPFVLIDYWRLLSRKSVPKVLGGKDFNKVIEAFEKKGVTGVEEVLQSVELPCFLKANAYTSVARHLNKKNTSLAADFAFKAFEEDPKPYRLKWLACRLGEANEFLRAEAMIELLPADMTYSDSEQRQLNQIRAEAKSCRIREAKKKTDLTSKQKLIQAQIAELRGSISELRAEKAQLLSERNEASRQVTELQSELERTQQENSELYTEKARLLQERDDVSRQVIQKIERIKKDQKKELEKSMKQIESCVRLQNYLGADIFLPEMHQWAISPDLGVLLINLVEQNEYGAVIEFGSGTSTLILAKALRRVGKRSISVPQLLSIDHLEQYKIKTERLIRQAKLIDNTKVVLAPLVEWQGLNGNSQPYYDCDADLEELQQSIRNQRNKILVLVDGPPSSTGEHARFPALNKVLHAFPPQEYEIDFLLDDYCREDEREVVKAWIEHLEREHISYVLTELKSFEKQACLLEIRNKCAGQP